MFNKKQENKNNLKEVEAVVGLNVKVKGHFNSKGNIIIEGELNGSIKSGGFLLVGDSAKIEASIEANEARIGGSVTGNIKIKGMLHIVASANILGDIECGQLSVEEGAHLNGRCTMLNVSKEQKIDKKLPIKPLKKQPEVNS
ncbi:MAG: polymer-forming cytoskeletal protein [Candidatus Falkowbacteria bacterium]|nr:polymer-forming cytoskeletal protein [Candidatus Falkowbacteria bacterium]